MCIVASCCIPSLETEDGHPSHPVEVRAQRRRQLLLRRRVAQLPGYVHPIELRKVAHVDLPVVVQLDPAEGLPIGVRT